MDELEIALEVTRILFMLTRFMINLNGILATSKPEFAAHISAEIWLIQPNVSSVLYWMEHDKVVRLALN